MMIHRAGLAAHTSVLSSSPRCAYAVDRQATFEGLMTYLLVVCYGFTDFAKNWEFDEIFRIYYSKAFRF